MKSLYPCLLLVILAFQSALSLASVEPLSVTERLRGARNARTRECNPTLTALVRARAPKNGCVEAMACEDYLVGVFSDLPTICLAVGEALDRANVNLEACRQKGHYDKSCEFDPRDRMAFHQLSEKIHLQVLDRMGKEPAKAAACDALERGLAANRLSERCRAGIENLLNARPVATGSAKRLATILEDLSQLPGATKAN